MTANASNPLSRAIAAGGQKLFLLTLSVAALLAALGFSFAIFGAFSGLLSTVTDQLLVIALGLGLIGIAGVLGYSALN
ncbi:hypothetical protein [Halolamina sp.]|jgi:hypothetical protein|uniref:hypothetical protein n=1 Tax=Halolamina sp. TaxID=1940283 RepID=UPI000223B5C3|nr:hypothetical protein Halar_1125 [halophilic archaeon DL31]